MAEHYVELQSACLILQRDVQKLIEDAKKGDKVCPQWGTYISKQDFRTLDAKLESLAQHVNSMYERSKKETKPDKSKAWK